jgi:hypothetical protein
MLYFKLKFSTFLKTIYLVSKQPKVALGYLSRVHSIYNMDSGDTLFSPLIPKFSRDRSDWNYSMEFCLSPPC